MDADKKNQISNYCFYLYEIRKKHFHALKNGFGIGRTQGDLVYEDDPLLSRRHLEFVIEGDHAMIKDLQTTNGMMVNDNRTVLQELNHNDFIKVGRQLFIFSLTDNVNDLKLDLQASPVKKITEVSPQEAKEELLDPKGHKDDQAKPERLIKLLVEGLKRPLDYKNINKIYYLVPAIIGLIHLLRLMFITSETYYGSLIIEGHAFFNFMVGYYFAVGNIFFLEALIKQNQVLVGHLAQKGQVIIMALITILVFFLFHIISADFLATTVVENTNKIDRICRLKPEVLKCSRMIHRLLEDQKLLNDPYKFKITNAYFDHLIMFL